MNKFNVSSRRIMWQQPSVRLGLETILCTARGLYNQRRETNLTPHGQLTIESKALRTTQRQACLARCSLKQRNISPKQPIRIKNLQWWQMGSTFKPPNWLQPIKSTWNTTLAQRPLCSWHQKNSVPQGSDTDSSTHCSNPLVSAPSKDRCYSYRQSSDQSPLQIITTRRKRLLCKIAVINTIWWKVLMIRMASGMTVKTIEFRLVLPRI